MTQRVTAQRCTVCLTNWPPYESFDTCPECDEPCRPSVSEECITYEEANRRRNRAEFERQYGPADVGVS